MSRPSKRSQRTWLPRPQRLLQAACLALFVLLVWQTAWPFSGWLVGQLPPDLFLRLDPAGMLGSALAVRAWLAGSLGLLLALAATLLVGRVFCGWICPFGTSVDLMDRALCGARPEASARLDPQSRTGAQLRLVKYGLLTALATAALLGVSLVFLLAPIPLITRLYALLLHPVLAALADAGLALSRPALDALDWHGLYYTQIPVPRFAQLWYVALFFGAVFGLALLAPRFWCRNLCPAGAVFALISWRPLLRRRVTDSCVHCGLCQKRCPMGAIAEDPLTTRHGECITCQLCVNVCPVAAISFAPALPWRDQTEQSAATGQVAASRRFFLLSGAAGAGAALLAVADLNSPHVVQGTGTVWPPNVIRPPGALPEGEFLARCVRCGACMKACPTNTLQPIGLGFGLSGLFSPTLSPRRGPCEPTCRACGLVCPTGALRSLPDMKEKTHAKLGTARVLPWKCLAWEHQRKCLVCDEVCPFDAIELVQKPGIPVPVPVVHEQRCAGCGFCEFHCPVREQRAIVVEPAGALRLERGSYVAAARAEGLQLSLAGHAGKRQQGGYGQETGYGQGAGYGQEASQEYGQPTPPGFDSPQQQGQGLPPGFSEPKDSGQGLPPGFSEPPDS